MSHSNDTAADLRILPLDAWHRAQGARMVPFAGYSMPVQYEGILAEHQWTRTHAGLFDVSHMGQLVFSGDDVAEALEALLPGDIRGLKPGRMRYSLLLDDKGGILDDLIVTNTGDALAMVVNGAMVEADVAHIRAHLPASVVLHHITDHALLALQGPSSAQVLEAIGLSGPGQLGFMEWGRFEWHGASLGVSRSGYTGEDGFEISVPHAILAELVDVLAAHDEVHPIGLGARDSLRLEAGLPLYGHDLTSKIEPVEAGLGFAVARRRREQGGFPGHGRIAAVLEQGPACRRVGLLVEGRLAAREGAVVLAGDTPIGTVTSGGFAPTLGRPIAMAYVDAAHAALDTPLSIDLRGRRLAATVTTLPFVPHRYHRKGAA
ncbi:glycine cleavage system aminomethyltransferase T [Novosphingobium nitrogenifigens DSM 19370]|uniref:aminomethyltransferase n=1 Tax=Novosphingobium nitrogenifigens DSM 19370 TaxID=983920 RepID=F1ZA30_9SPHN|nr:glycine cleavage system aminomethyltransferase GcvT [Novosphingobium nitrogenifigens]EGD58562.1 glycine cleavage system aminomethyltransferase T [Novosphingobium nitrogenifigens DSM 19370]